MRAFPTRRSLRWLGRLYLTVAALYVVLGFVLMAAAYGRGQEVNPLIPVPAGYEEVPTGSDDAAVKAYYDYLNFRHLDYLSQTDQINPLIITTIYGILGAILVTFYFLILAWYARQPQNDLYPVESFNGYVSERGGPVDSFNWAVYLVIAGFIVYYTVVNLIFGQYY